MRIGFDTHYISSGHGTGNCTYTAETMRALIRLDQHNHYVLYAMRDHGYYEQFVNNPRVQVRPVLSSNGLIRNFLSIPKAIAEDNPDIVHLQFFLPFPANFLNVLTVPDLWYLHMHSSTLVERLLGLLAVWSVRRADHVITHSEFSKTDIVSKCKIPAKHVTVIPHGVNERFAPKSLELIQEVRNRLHVPSSYLLYVGRTDDSRKNLTTLIKAYAKIKHHLDVCEYLVIAGHQGAGTRKIQEQACDLQIEDYVLFPGFIDDENLPSLISGAKIFIYISSFEGFGLPVLEAMACGTPVITSNATSLPEVVGDAGLMVEPGNVEALADAMEKILNDEDLQDDLQRRGLIRASQFSWSRAAQQTMRVYKRLIG